MIKDVCYLFTETRSQRISVQLQDAREKFTQIAESHATALQVTYLLLHHNI